MDKIFEFSAVPERLVYNSENFKIYGCSINGFDYPDIKINQYGNVTIKGDIVDLALGVDYSIKAKEVSDRHGYSYEVIYLKRDKPTSLASTRNFLYEILTENQTNTLLAVYPDIVDRVIHDRLDDIDLNKLHGIKEYTFNVIKNKIIENFKLADLVEEFKGLFKLSVIKKLYEKYTSVDKVKEKIREEPYQCLCNLGGVGFKTADDLLLTLYKDSKKCKENGDKPSLYFGFDLPTSYQRAKACVDYLLNENETSGNTYMHVGDLKKQFDVLVPEAKSNLAMILKDENNDVVFDRDSLSVCKKSTYEAEKYIAERIKDGLKVNTEWDIDCSKYGIVDGFSLTEDQSKTIQCMCKHNIAMLVGGGGVGKSFSTQAFINLLKDNDKSYLLLAPTGRAAKVLAGYTKEDAMTIHRGLGYVPPNWTFNEEYKLTKDVVIVDEFSMVDVYLFKHLLEAIDFNRTKLLLIGDDAQIPSVGCGNILYDFLNSNIIPAIRLDKVFRYGSGGLLTVATDIRNSKEYLNKSSNEVQIFGDDKAYIYMPIEQEKIIDYTVSLYKKLLQSGYTIDDIGVLTCYNVGNYGTVALNQKLQDAINPNPDAKMQFGNIEFRLNDIVMNVVNDYKAIRYSEDFIDEDDTTFIANGESGRIKKILKEGIVVDYDGTLIYVKKSSMKNIRLAYSIGLHRSQGGSFKVVILVTPRSQSYMLNSNLIYVGITRAKERCYHLGELKTINTALKKKENFDRKTMLQTFIKGL